MGELQNAPPVSRPDNWSSHRGGAETHDKLHVHEIAEAQRTDPIIHWFVEQIARPVSQGRHPKTRETPDMHTEAKTMLRLRGLFKLAGGAEFGGHEVLVF